MIRPFLLAASFLTRLPVPFITPHSRELGQSAAFYPLIGLLLGLLLLGVGLLLSGRTSPELSAAILVTLLAMLTGGLHLDGVADCSDALGVFGDRQRRLEVMKDPRSGALGVAALTLTLVLKVLALSEAGVWMLPAALVVSRWVAVVLAVALPYARERGLGGALSSQAGWREVLIGAIIVAAVLAVSGPVAWLGAAGGLVAALWLARTMHRALGGLTGDVYGAAIEATEVSFFIAVAIVA